ncbi:MAG: LamG domain-containing protein, partial [Longimicrobiales bacterium]|nr:LamG domain-containing protein [Longimicrobiales bacterium]
MSIPGINRSYDQAIAELAPWLSQSTEPQGQIIPELPAVDRTFLLVADIYDPVNLNLLKWSDDPTNAVWNKGSVTVATGEDDPLGGTDAWKVTDPTTSANVQMNQDFAAGDGVASAAARVWVKADSASQIDIGIYNNTDLQFESQQVRKIQGPGSVSVSGNLPRIQNLSASVWTLIEISLDAPMEDGDTYRLLIYPGGAGSTTANDSNIVFRPQAQYKLSGRWWTSPVRKTEGVNGPGGADGQGVTIFLSNNGWTSGTTGLTNNNSGRTIPQHQLFSWGLKEPYNASSQLFRGGRVEGQALPGFGDITIANPAEAGEDESVFEEGAYDAIVLYTWSNRPLEVYHGNYDDDFSDFTPIFIGTAENLRWTTTEAAVQLRDRQFKLNKFFQERLFGGFGACLRYDGSGDKVAVGGHPATYIQGDLTLEARVRWYAQPAAGGEYLASWAGSGETEPLNFQWSLYHDGALDRFVSLHEYGSGASDELKLFSAGTANWYDGSWHHVALVRRAADQELDLYLDGDLHQTLSYSNDPTGGEDGVLTIGAHPGGTNEWSGDLDEVRIWRRALTHDELNNSRGRTLAGSEEGLAAYYRLDEGTGSETYDEVTNQRVQLREGLFFDGVDDHVQVTDHADFDPTANGEITVEVVCSPATDNTGGAADAVVRRDNTFQVAQVDDRWRVAIHDGTTFRSVTSSPVVQAGKEAHLTMVWDDDTEQISLYVDGVFNASNTYSGSSVNDGAADIYFGSNGAGQWWHGWAFEVRFWNVIRSAQQILDSYGSQLSGSETGLKGYWKIDEGSGSTAGDTTAGGHDGTITGASWEDTTGAITGASWVGSGEGGLDLAGKPVPAIYGRARHVPLVLVDALNLVYLAGEGPLEEIEEVMEGAGGSLVSGGDTSNIWAHVFVLSGNPTTAQGAGATTLIDTSETFVTKGIQVGQYVRNVTDGGSGVVVSVDSETQITHTALSGGTNNDWQTGDTYELDSDYVTDLAHGFVRFQAAPSKPPTAHVKGDSSGAGYVSDAGSIVRRIAT